MFSLLTFKMKSWGASVLLLAVCLFLSDKTWADRCCDDQLGCFKTSGSFSIFYNPWCADEFDMVFGLFTRDNPESVKTVNRTSIPSEFSPSRQTIFLIHGWQNKFSTPFLHDIKDALLEKEDANVIVVGWGGGAGSVFYPYSAATTRVVGAEAAIIMDQMKESGLEASKLWCVGHSLGAHTCGFAGSNTKIGRITGLDPTRKVFDGADPVARLSADDADFVDVIHTDGWSPISSNYGIFGPIGDADYYPNKGYKQPGCLTKRHLELEKADFEREMMSLDDGAQKTISRRVLSSLACSHMRAHQYFLQSIKNENCFPVAQNCDEYYYIPKNCKDCANCGVMGYGADQLIDGALPQGIYYMDTTSKDPYCSK